MPSALSRNLAARLVACATGTLVAAACTSGSDGNGSASGAQQAAGATQVGGAGSGGGVAVGGGSAGAGGSGASGGAGASGDGGSGGAQAGGAGSGGDASAGATGVAGGGGAESMAGGSAGTGGSPCSTEVSMHCVPACPAGTQIGDPVPDCSSSGGNAGEAGASGASGAQGACVAGASGATAAGGSGGSAGEPDAACPAMGQCALSCEPGGVATCVGGCMYGPPAGPGVRMGDMCCYTFVKVLGPSVQECPGLCGRPIEIEGTNRMAQVMRRSDWS
jgi:hypothetical protein